MDGLVFEARKALIEAKNELDLNPNDITTRNVFKEREKEVQVAQLARKSYQKYKRI